MARSVKKQMKRRSNPDVHDLMIEDVSRGVPSTDPLTVRKAIEYGLPLSMREMIAIEAAIDAGADVMVRAHQWNGEVVWTVKISGLSRRPRVRESLSAVGFRKQNVRVLHGSRETADTMISTFLRRAR